MFQLWRRIHHTSCWTQRSAAMSSRHAQYEQTLLSIQIHLFFLKTTTTTKQALTWSTSLWSYFTVLWLQPVKPWKRRISAPQLPTQQQTSQSSSFSVSFRFCPDETVSGIALFFSPKKKKGPSFSATFGARCVSLFDDDLGAEFSGWATRKWSLRREKKGLLLTPTGAPEPLPFIWELQGLGST